MIFKTMKGQTGLLLLIILCMSHAFTSDCHAQQRPDMSGRKVVAYLPACAVPSYTPRWEKITHLCLAFGFVQADGNVDVTEVLKHRGVVEEAHRHGVKVLLSVGGGGSRNFSPAILDEQCREKLVGQLTALTADLGLDGIDIDYEEWEGGPQGAGTSDLEKRVALEALYRELRAALGPDKLIAAAVGALWDTGGFGTYNCYNETMHCYLDFVSLMIYDATGPWPSSHIGQHSGWMFFEKAIEHWLVNRKLPREKLVAGVPFYGYRFVEGGDIKDTQSMTYKQILETYPDEEAHLKDSIGLLYYNGIPTIRRKVEYVKQHRLGGIMLWEITQDTDKESKSLLNVIHRCITD